MPDYSQTQNTGNLQKFIKEIPSRGIPEKVTYKYLESIGYTSKNDRTIPAVLKFLGVLESNGVPAGPFTKLRDKNNARKELVVLIKNAYSDLFETYSDANAKDNETLKTWFTSNTSVGEASVRNMTQTFIALCSLADWDGVPASDSKSKDNKKADESDQGPAKRKHRKQLDAQIAFNIQVQIPGDQSPEVYEAIFKNLGKYVLGIEDDE